MSHQYFTIVMIMSFLLLGFQDSLNRKDTLPKVKVIDVGPKKVVMVVKPVIDRPFFDSLSAIRTTIGAQRQAMDSIATDVIPKSEFDALLTAQKAQNARLRRIFNKLPTDVQRLIIKLDSIESLNPVSYTEYNSYKPELPEVKIMEPHPGFFERLRRVFHRNKHRNKK